MNNINELYNLWLEKATADPDLKKELLGVKGNDDEVLDRFYRSLEFGTAGLRGVIGAGTITPSAEQHKALPISLTSILKTRQSQSAMIQESNRNTFLLKQLKLLPQTVSKFIFMKNLSLHLAFHSQSGILKHQAVLFSPLRTTLQNITDTNAIMKTDIK